MIANVYIWQNGMVMVFDERGQQMPEYQGTAEEAMPKIRAAATPETKFHGGDWEAKTVWPLAP